ncbi:MAG: phosphotransacetylase family protein [Cyanobacteria bacterium J06626_23]
MPNNMKSLLIGSTEPYSGKTATVLGLGLQLKQRGLDIAYGKPIGTCSSERLEVCPDEDRQFITETLELTADRVKPTLFSLDAETIRSQLTEPHRPDYSTQLASYREPTGDLLLIEGPGTLDEGALFELSLSEIADQTDTQVILVARFQSMLIVDSLLAAKQKLGNRLLGVVINDVPDAQMSLVETAVKDCLVRHQIPVFGILPSSPIMRSVSVGELVERLNAEILCCPDRTDALVESLSIGAMNVNSALKYFRRADNMAVVTGGDRADIQLAALETSTQCLILTGYMPPKSEIINRAKELEVPILAVDLDTLTTVEKIEKAFQQVRLQEPIKVQCMHLLMEKHFDIDQLMAMLSLPAAVPV